MKGVLSTVEVTLKMFRRITNPAERGVTNIHELAGHAYLNITQPTLKKNDHNKLVENLHKQIFLNYKINGAIWYKRSTVPLHEREEE